MYTLTNMPGAAVDALFEFADAAAARAGGTAVTAVQAPVPGGILVAVREGERAVAEVARGRGEAAVLRYRLARSLREV